MQNLIRIIKSIKIKQVLTVFLLSGFLLVGTACSDDNVAQAGGQGYTETAKRAASDTYDDYDADQGFKGGMNGYNDDRRYNSKTAAKTKGLIDAAENRLQQGSADVDLDDVTDRVGNEIDRAQRNLGDKKDRAVNYVQDKSENLKDNLSKVPGGAKEVFDEATDTAGNAIEDANQATKSTARRIKGNVKDIT